MNPSNQKAHGKTKKPASAPLCTSNILSKFLDAPSAAPATHVAFCKFIELADLKSIKQFFATTFLSPDSHAGPLYMQFSIYTYNIVVDVTNQITNVMDQWHSQGGSGIWTQHVRLDLFFSADVDGLTNYVIRHSFLIRKFWHHRCATSCGKLEERMHRHCKLGYTTSADHPRVGTGHPLKIPAGFTPVAPD